MIIDVHTHIFPDAVCNNRSRFLDERSFALLYSSEKSKTVNTTQLVAMMDSEAVDCAVALGFQWWQKDMALLHNESLQKALEDNKGRIVSFGCIAREERDIDGTARLLAAAGFKGIGEVAFYEGMAEPEYDFLEQVLAAAEKHGLAVNLHCSEGPGHTYSGKHEMSLMRLYQLLCKYPETKTICAHYGGGLIFYETMPEVAENLKHVVYDTAACIWLYRPDIHAIAGQLCGRHKILFGSDYPLALPSRYKTEVFCNLDESYQNSILADNAARFLGFDLGTI